MNRELLYYILLITLLSCNSQVKTKTASLTDATLKVETNKSVDSQVYKYEQKYISRQKILTSRLGLYDLQKAAGDFELRLWTMPSMWDPSTLLILKQTDSTWLFLFYQFYTLSVSDPNNYWDSPKVDSVKMESLHPQKTSWKTYIENLKLDSLTTLQTESEIVGKKFEVVDGYRILLEFAEKGQYKYLFYTAPDYFQEKDMNHKKFILFKERLINPVRYKGIHNL
jgi:hypothetical protein